MKHDENLCAEIDSSLPLYVGGDLEAKALAEVRLHLADCPRCAERALAARAARRELVAALRIESRPGPDLWAGVRAALVDEGVLAPAPSAPHSRTWSRPWGLVAAAAAVVLGFWIGARWNDAADVAPNRETEAPVLVHQPRARTDPRGLDLRGEPLRSGMQQTVRQPIESPRLVVTPVVDRSTASELVSTDSTGGPTGLRRLSPDERPLRDSAPLSLGDRAYLYGAAPQSGAMQPVGLQRVGATVPRW